MICQFWFHENENVRFQSAGMNKSDQIPAGRHCTALLTIFLEFELALGFFSVTLSSSSVLSSLSCVSIEQRTEKNKTTVQHDVLLEVVYRNA